MNLWYGVQEGMLAGSLLTAQLTTSGKASPQRRGKASAPAVTEHHHRSERPPPLEFHDIDADSPCNNAIRAIQEAIRVKHAEQAESAAEATRAWLVVSSVENRGVRSATNLQANILLTLAENDILVSWGSAAQTESMWISFKAGDQIFRRGK